MARTNVEIMRESYEALRRGDMAALLEVMDREVEIRDRPESPDARTYRGHEGVLATVQQNIDTFDDVELHPEQFVGRGDRVVVTIRMRGRGKESGVPVEDRIAHLWTMQAGKAVALQVYSDPADALEAAGIES